MCSGSFSQNLVTSQFPSAQSQSQPIGEDILNLCTGNFYNNQFVSQSDEVDCDKETVHSPAKDTEREEKENQENVPTVDNSKNLEDTNILKSILDELNDPELEAPRPTLKYFTGNRQNKDSDNNTQHKKKFIIDSDDENKDTSENEPKKKKRLKKKKLEERALQFSGKFI